MAKDNNLEQPKAGAGDVAHALVRAGLGAIPVAGAAATELLNAIVTPPLERRRNEWMQRVGAALRNLEEQRGVNLEDLQNNDGFLDVTMHASQVALRNSQEEKLRALRNAILNSALPSPPEESLQQMFIDFVDSLTVWHLKLLDLLQGPEQWATRHHHTFHSLSAGGFSAIIESAYPELRRRRDFYDQLGKDLTFRGLTHTDNFQVTMTGSGLMQKRTTNMGDKFLQFISNPINEEQT
jgi:hypothetical protein